MSWRKNESFLAKVETKAARKFQLHAGHAAGAVSVLQPGFGPAVKNFSEWFKKKNQPHYPIAPTPSQADNKS